MWFNHKTVIFGDLDKAKKRPEKKAQVSTKRSHTADLGRDQLADIGIEAPASNTTFTDAARAMIHESRFTGYRGEAIA